MICRDLGMLPSDMPLPPLEHHPLVADDSNVHYVNAQASGIFVPHVEHWRHLQSGQVLGEIVSPYEAKPLCQVTAPVSGLLFTLREHPLVYEGSLMARIMKVAA